MSTFGTMGSETDVRGWLRQQGAEAIAHVGGTLYAHLCRVHERLVDLGCDPSVQAAGLTHAVYGTDGFDVALLDPTDRGVLRQLVGAEAEELVYLYGACDRQRSWRRLATTGQVFDRFANAPHALCRARLRQFVELSIVNELDVAEQDPTMVDTHGAYFRELFTSWAPLASREVIRDAQRVFRR